MATALHAFTDHEFGTIRAITSGGQVLFYGKDVATALGYANTKDALVRHCKGVVNHYPFEKPGGIQQVRFISEGVLLRRGAGVAVAYHYHRDRQGLRPVGEEAQPDSARRAGAVSPVRALVPLRQVC